MLFTLDGLHLGEGQFHGLGAVPFNETSNILQTGSLASPSMTSQGMNTMFYCDHICLINISWSYFLQQAFLEARLLPPVFESPLRLEAVILRPSVAGVLWLLPPMLVFKIPLDKVAVVLHPSPLRLARLPLASLKPQVNFFLMIFFLISNTWYLVILQFPAAELLQDFPSPLKWRPLTLAIMNHQVQIFIWISFELIFQPFIQTINNPGRSINQHRSDMRILNSAPSPSWVSRSREDIQAMERQDLETFALQLQAQLDVYTSFQGKLVFSLCSYSYNSIMNNFSQVLCMKDCSIWWRRLSLFPHGGR